MERYGCCVASSYAPYSLPILPEITGTLNSKDGILTRAPPVSHKRAWASATPLPLASSLAFSLLVEKRQAFKSFSAVWLTKSMRNWETEAPCLHPGQRHLRHQRDNSDLHTSLTHIALEQACRCWNPRQYRSLPVKPLCSTFQTFLWLFVVKRHICFLSLSLFLSVFFFLRCGIAQKYASSDICFYLKMYPLLLLYWTP